MSQHADFWDRAAEKYSKRPVPDEAIYERKLAMTRDYLKPEMHVLEFGCGTGTTALHHAPHVRRILATDVSESMLAIARKKAETARVNNVTFQQVSVEAFPAEDASFDVVMAHSVLHLLDDRDEALSKIFRLIKPGGHLITSTPCLGSMSLPMRLFLRVALPIGQALGKIPDVRFFSNDDLIASVKAAGFSVLKDWHPEKSPAIFIVAEKSH